MSPLQLFSQELEALVKRASSGVAAVSTSSGNGSATVLSRDGFVLTNAHVVSRQRQVSLKWSQGSEVRARVVGVDALSDLAVLSAPSPVVEPLTFASEAEIGVGQLVVALGHPFGFERSMSLGVISAVERSLPSRSGAQLSGLLQTDAAINPGNSGGPLVDVQGRVVGINTAMLPYAQGIGFAVPSFVAAWVVPLLMRHGSVRRRFIGIAARNELLGERLAEDHGQRQAVRVLEVQKRSPAELAGIRSNDLLTRVSGEVVASVNDFQRVLAIDENVSVDLMLLRGGKPVSVQLRPQSRAA
jgi:serine protease Do